MNYKYATRNISVKLSKLPKAKLCKGFYFLVVKTFNVVDTEAIGLKHKIVFRKAPVEHLFRHK